MKDDCVSAWIEDVDRRYFGFDYARFIVAVGCSNDSEVMVECTGTFVTFRENCMSMLQRSALSKALAGV